MSKVGRSIQLARRSHFIAHRAFYARDPLRSSLAPFPFVYDARNDVFTGDLSCVNAKLSVHKPKAVIFDKDGTLICLHHMWGTWLDKVASNMEQKSRISNLRHEIFDSMGYCPDSKKVKVDGEMAATPMELLHGILVERLARQGLTTTSATDIVDHSWVMPEVKSDLTKPLTDLKSLFEELHSRGLKIGIATTDDRDATLETMEHLDLVDYVDAVSCGSDPIVSKPAPDMMHACAEQLNIAPEHMVMVGDTLKDLRMGKEVDTALNVAVVEDETLRILAPEADVCVSNIDAMLHLEALRADVDEIVTA